MKTDKQKVKRISLRLRDGCPQHQALLRYCQKRDKEKYHSMTDYLASAVEAFETENYITLRMSIETLTTDEQEAVGLLLCHNNTKTKKR